MIRLGPDSDGLQAAGTEAIDGLRGHINGQPGENPDAAREIHALRAFWHGTAHNHIIDFGRIELTLGFLQQIADDGGGHIIRAHVACDAFFGFSDGCTTDRYDYSFSHRTTSIKLSKQKRANARFLG